MNILIVSQYFWPENFRINDLALGLLERGYNVTVLTGVPNYPKGKFFEGYRFFNKIEDYKGVKVVRVPLIPRGNNSGLALAINYLSFALSACFFGPLFCKDKYDLILVFQMSPVTQGFPAILLKKIHKCPLYFWVQDLWPESLSATGAVKSEKIIRIVGKMVSFIYRRCDRILVQSRSFVKSVVDLGGKPDKISYFPNSAEGIFTHLSQDIVDLPEMPLGFKVMFAGNIGAAQDFETILTAAKKLQDVKDLNWIIVGDGRMRQWAEAKAFELGLNNIIFLGSFPLNYMPSFFMRADTMLVTLKREPIFSLTIPSKIQSYMASGKPIIAALDGEGAKIIDESGSGFTCQTNNADDLSKIVHKMYKASQNERDKMGLNGKTYYKMNFDRELLLDRLVGWISEDLGKKEK